ncbi:MAG: hypothetical protein MJ117_00425 [Lachnospiraceae bacterium]|nr:hypothetical protein [Lachnospiraceae bacterium]
MRKRQNEYLVVSTIPSIHQAYANVIKANTAEEARAKFFDTHCSRYRKIIEIRQMSQFDWTVDPEMDQLEMELII